MEDTTRDGESTTDQSRTDDPAVVAVDDIDPTDERVAVDVVVLILNESARDGESHCGFVADTAGRVLEFGIEEDTLDVSDLDEDDSIRLTNLQVEDATHERDVTFTDETTLDHLDHEIVEVSRA